MSNLSANPQGRQQSDRSGYEKRDANAAWIFGVVGFLLISGFIIHLCMAGVLERMNKRLGPEDSWTGARPRGAQPMELKTVPRLQLAPEVDLQKFHEREDAELNGYGWINRATGVVRIPIERAMELTVERGLHARSETNSTQLGPSSYELQQQRPFSPQPEIQDQQ